MSDLLLFSRAIAEVSLTRINRFGICGPDCDCGDSDGCDGDCGGDGST
jgi:hypothetical protein